MGDAPTGTKRKRSVIACSTCHDRKVRCNVSLQGLPCSNCVQDGSSCEIYLRKIGIPGQRPLRQRQSPPNEERVYPLTPSPGSARDRSSSSNVGIGMVEHPAAQIATSAEVTQDLRIQEHLQEKLGKSPGTSTDGGGVAKDVARYFAGESHGLEFLFDQCAPERPIKGLHYLTPMRTYRHRRSTSKVRRLEPPFPNQQVQQELIRCFFHYVYPVLPVVNAKDFLETYERNPSRTSPLLLWSIFFAALNYVDKDVLRAHRMPSRKILKEQYYQHAKDGFDNQDENDKTTLIQAALLLSMWYVDLEDRDGTWFWIGTAISLAQTVGLHRASNYAMMRSCPFPAELQQLWRRLWWSCFHREAWIAMGFGRPMRVHIDDCDEAIPRSEEIMEELREIPAHLRERFLPSDLNLLVDAWIVLLHLSISLADILTMHYRPRSRLPAPPVLRQQEAEMINLRNKIPATSFSTSRVALIHICHLEMYFNAALIILYRPYLGCSPLKIADPDCATCQNECVLKAKAAAADTTNVLNRLMTLNAVSQSSSTFVVLLVNAMLVLAYEMRNSSGLSKSYASHQLDLHMLVLSHLRKTYWTADLEHNLFSEVLKVMNGGVPAHTENAPTPANERTPRDDLPLAQSEHAAPEMFDPGQGLVHATMDEFFIFNPFMGLPSHDELSTSVEWDLSPPSSLNIQSISGRWEA